MKRFAFLFLIFVALWPTLSEAKGKSSRKVTGWVRLYADKHFESRSMTITQGANIRDMRSSYSDDGKVIFNDKTCSMQFDIPPGWEAVLWEDPDFGSRSFVMRGKGQSPDLGYLQNKMSSLEWRKSKSK